MELHFTARRNRHDVRVEAQRAGYTAHLATFLPRSLRHLHDKRMKKSDYVAAVRQPNLVVAPSPLISLHPRTHPRRASSALGLIILGGSPCFLSKHAKPYLPFAW
jgi:hypothetical protein